MRALDFDSKRVQRRLLEPLGLLRKRAGKIRDMDVLLGDVLSLQIPGEHTNEKSGAQTAEKDCILRLLQHLAVKRHKHARKMDAIVRALGRPLLLMLARQRSAIAKVARKNSRSNSNNDQAGNPSLRAVARSLQLAEQLNQPARLNRANLHPYRLKLRELRYVLEMEEPQPSRQGLIAAVEKVQDAIGEWHDWMSLGDIAADVLDHDGCRVIARIKAEANSRFVNALALAESLRERYAAESPARKAPSRKTSRQPNAPSTRPKKPRQKPDILPVRTLKATVADAG